MEKDVLFTFLRKKCSFCVFRTESFFSQVWLHLDMYEHLILHCYVWMNHHQATQMTAHTFCSAFLLPSSTVAFHGLQLKIKKEPHSPCSELGSNCSQDRPFKLQYGEKCLYNIRCVLRHGKRLKTLTDAQSSFQWKNVLVAFFVPWSQIKGLHLK